MKKIVLTLGIFLSAYATYALNSNEKLEIESNNSVGIVEEEYDGCYIREETWKDGVYLYSTYYPIPC